MQCGGFRFGAACAGIKQSGAPDIGLIVADRPVATAAVFTRNRVKAAPVRVSRAALVRNAGMVQAVIVNSGNANACTGRPGMTDARTMIASTAAAVKAKPTQVLVASTGVIGVPLPMANVRAGIAAAATNLKRRNFAAFAEAILTTDRAAKLVRSALPAGGGQVRLMGCTKGAGMIAPNMATTLTFVTTDARLPAHELQQLLANAAADTFNAITVDGDTSTNDMITLMASGTASQRTLGARDRARFGDALRELLGQLARKLMAGGEGVHHVVTVKVRGARTVASARKVARTIANSPLVKTAIAGQDPNWGRILSAAGMAGVALVPDQLGLSIGSVQVAKAGQRAPGTDLDRRAAAVMARPEYELTLDLHLGTAQAHYLACDLSHDYVTINADYRT